MFNYYLITVFTRFAQLENCPNGAGVQKDIDNGVPTSCLTTLPEVNADNATLAKVLPILFGTITAIAVLVIVVQGIRFILSQGEPDKAIQARKGVIYAAVGLAVVFLADIIVAFILKRFL